MPQCLTDRHPVSLVLEWKKYDAGTGIRRPSPLLEYSGTRLRWLMPEYRCWRHQPWCWCPTMPITKSKSKVWWHYATLFEFYYYFFNIHSQNTITLRSSFTIPRGPSSWILIASSLSKGSLHGMPSRDLNSSLPYSKPTHYQLSCAASLILKIQASVICCKFK